jgi:REP element-mobilizing transposase RayT
MEQLPKRKQHRLQQYDYSQNGYYFITICTHHRKPLLCRVGNAVPGVPPSVTPTPIGNAVLSAWICMSEIDPYIHTDAFCLMPNHIHGIIVIDAPEGETAERRGRRSLPDLVRAFKSTTTREFNRMNAYAGQDALWQSSYYDTVIRNDAHLNAVRAYIDINPAKWPEDEYYTETQP